MRFRLGLEIVDLSVSALYPLPELKQRVEGLKSLRPILTQRSELCLHDIIVGCEELNITVQSFDGKHLPMLNNEPITNLHYYEFLEALVRGYFTIVERGEKNV